MDLVIETTPSTTIVSLPALPGLGYGSLAPIPAVCPKCRRRQDPWVHPLFTNLFKKHEPGVDVYGSQRLCVECDAELERVIDPSTGDRATRLGIPPKMQHWSMARWPGPLPLKEFGLKWLGTMRADIVLFGPPGVGKTGFAISLLNEASQRGVWGRFTSAADLMLDLKLSFSDKSQRSEGEILKGLASERVLVLDDISAIRHTPYFKDVMHTLPTLRQTHQRPTIYTMNASRDELIDAFGPVLYDRLREHAHFIEVTGISNRGVLSQAQA